MPRQTLIGPRTGNRFGEDLDWAAMHFLQALFMKFIFLPQTSPRLPSSLSLNTLSDDNLILSTVANFRFHNSEPVG